MRRNALFSKFCLALSMLLLPILSAYGTTAEIKTDVAIFAGGCFWCMEAPFDSLPGVIDITVGYIGGHKKNPTYEQVSAGKTGHAEAVQIRYNPKKISYEKLLTVFWRQIDPFVKDAQFCDQGSQYRSAIFYTDETQKKLAENSKAELEKSTQFKSKIVTEISSAGIFYSAEDYHQHYYKKNPICYKYYRTSCGRDSRLREIWGSAASHK
ncbi:MAG: peptide-methionine (S)-S-oxide reductase MsrA [Oligoflexales bacterium]|nr:peptide-methionine (S)-S-oxide reductase MsrA [Oligoflexales bacterium]